LLPRHLARFTRSARELRLPIDPAALPDLQAVAALIEADRREGDALLRLTLSGGRSEADGSTLWMRSGPLPPPPRPGGAVLGPPGLTVAESDPLARHKTRNYWAKRIALERMHALGYDETLIQSPDGAVWEGARTNLFVVRGATLATPCLGGPVLPGVMRSVVLERAERLGVRVEQGRLSLAVLDQADEVFLTNSVRGIVPVVRFGERTLNAPGPLTRRLWDEILPWLNSGGTSP
jgi:branched-subunit amino acid aminotransferase/4-amino-4-deoxychorismate lyase